MKKYKVMVLHTIVYEVEVNAETKEEAENKIKDIDVNTNLLDQTDDVDFLAAYQAFESDDNDELMGDEGDADSEDVVLTDQIKTPMPSASVLASTEFVRTNSLVKGYHP